MHDKILNFKLNNLTGAPIALNLKIYFSNAHI